MSGNFEPPIFSNRFLFPQFLFFFFFFFFLRRLWRRTPECTFARFARHTEPRTFCTARTPSTFAGSWRTLPRRVTIEPHRKKQSKQSKSLTENSHISSNFGLSSFAGKHVPMVDTDIEDMYNASPLLKTLTEPPKSDNFPLFGDVEVHNYFMMMIKKKKKKKKKKTFAFF